MRVKGANHGRGLSALQVKSLPTTATIPLFCFGLLLLTRLDYFINGDLYNLYGYGLEVAGQGFLINQVLYACLWQFFLFLLFLVSRSWRLWLVEEGFVLTSGPDLIFYAVWNGGVFPSGDWTWVGFYGVFGVWQTVHQVALTFAATCMVAFGLLLARKMK